MSSKSRWTRSRSILLQLALMVLAITFHPATALPQSKTLRVNLGPAGTQSLDHSYSAEICADGSFVAYPSPASNLVQSDNNFATDVFVSDAAFGTTLRVSLGSTGGEINGISTSPSISADGNLVAFFSQGTNVVSGVTAQNHSYVRNRAAGTTIIVSVDSNGTPGNLGGYHPMITPDGRYVVFGSGSTNLVTNDNNNLTDIFRRDLLTGQTVRVNLDPSGNQTTGYTGAIASVSADGRFVAFVTDATDLIPGLTGGNDHVYVKDVQTGAVQRASQHSSGGIANDDCWSASISANGQSVLFTSDASNLVDGDTSGIRDVFRHDRSTQETIRVTLNSWGQEANSFSGGGRLSADGRFATFWSAADNLVNDDTNDKYDCFLRDCLTGQTIRCSLTTLGQQANDSTESCSISASGRSVAFTSQATNLVSGDTNGKDDVFVRDRTELWGFPLCFGDGSDSPCPCGNEGSSGEGCSNSTGAGSTLTATGTSGILADDLVLTASGSPANQTGMFLQGSIFTNEGEGTPFQDGLRCCSGAVIRIEIVTVDTAGGASTTVSVAGEGMVGAGDLRCYQFWYRDPNNSPCGAFENLTNGFSVTWQL